MGKNTNEFDVDKEFDRKYMVDRFDRDKFCERKGAIKISLIEEGKRRWEKRAGRGGRGKARC